MWQYSYTISLCVHIQVLINRGCIEPCLQSLLRAKLRRRERGVEGIEAPDILLMEVIFSAMGTLLKSVNNTYIVIVLDTVNCILA